MDFRAIIAGLAFALMWSSAFTSARIIVTNAPPLMVSSVRFLIAGLVTLAIARALGQSFRLTPQQWRLTIVFGVCQNALYLGLNFVAMQTVEASVAVIIASSLPLWVALAGWVIWRETMRPLAIIGLIGGFVGMGVIMGTRLGAGLDPFGVFLCVLGVLALTFATLSVRGASAGGNVLTVVGFQMLVGAIALALPASFETWTVNWSPTLVIAILYTIFVPGVIATITWFWLVNRIGTVRAATFHFLNPFLGVAVAAALLGEALAPLDIAGVVIIALSILAVQVSRTRST
ncbi:MAG: EamA family transporter [Boseongicola sp.]|nr:MAG: EamA family transporter [Boseongicola sp.]